MSRQGILNHGSILDILNISTELVTPWDVMFLMYLNGKLLIIDLEDLDVYLFR